MLDVIFMSTLNNYKLWYSVKISTVNITTEEIPMVKIPMVKIST